MPENNVIRVKNELYQQAKDLAQSEGISLADAVGKLVEKGGLQPSSCELSQFQRVLEAQGLTPPKQADWVWGITEILPPDVLAGTKLEPYAAARHEAELRCTLGNELFDKLIGDLGSAEAVEKALDGAIDESAPAEPVAEAETAEPETSPAEPTDIFTSFDAKAGDESASPPAEAEPGEVIEPAVEEV